MSHTGTMRTLLALACMFCALVAVAAKEFTMPRIYGAKTYAAHDEHAQENVTLAADPYDTGEKSAIFVSEYRDRGILPIFVVVTNDGDQPITMGELKVQLVTVDRAKLKPATEEDLYRRLGRSYKRPDSPRISPIPLPRRAPKA